MANLSPTRPQARAKVYDVLDGERDYQDEHFHTSPEPTVSEFAALVDEYAVKLVTPFAPSPAEPALTVDQEAARAKVAMKRFREIGAICVHALEVYGAPPRENHVPASAGITGEMHAVTKTDALAPEPHHTEPEQHKEPEQHAPIAHHSV
jgi:hypothetical protein